MVSQCRVITHAMEREYLTWMAGDATLTRASPVNWRDVGPIAWIAGAMSESISMDFDEPVGTREIGLQSVFSECHIAAMA